MKNSARNSIKAIRSLLYSISLFLFPIDAFANNFDYLGKTLVVNSDNACGALTANGGPISRMRLIRFPGNQNYENHFFKNVDYIWGILGLNGSKKPSINFYDDSSAPNAVAIMDNNGDLYAVFGAAVMEKIKYSYPNSSDLNTAALNALIAHELGHLAQYSYGYRGNTKNMELMADAISGFIASLQHGSQTSSNELGLELAQKAAYESGDFQYTDPDHHGTPSERLAAFQYGYKRAPQYLNGNGTRVSTGLFMSDAAQKFGVPFHASDWEVIPN